MTNAGIRPPPILRRGAAARATPPIPGPVESAERIERRGSFLYACVRAGNANTKRCERFSAGFFGIFLEEAGLVLQSRVEGLAGMKWGSATGWRPIWFPANFFGIGRSYAESV